MAQPNSKPYLIVGRKDTDITANRLEIEYLQSNEPKQFALFILAFLAIQGRDASLTSLGLSASVPPAAQFVELAGIHGLPYKASMEEIGS